MKAHIKAYNSAATASPNNMISNVTFPLKMSHIKKNTMYMEGLLSKVINQMVSNDKAGTALGQYLLYLFR